MATLQKRLRIFARMPNGMLQSHRSAMLDAADAIDELVEALEFYADKHGDGYDAMITDYGLSLDCEKNHQGRRRASPKTRHKIQVRTMKNAPEASREKLLSWLDENTLVRDRNAFLNPCARKMRSARGAFDWFTDDQLREIANHVISNWRFNIKIRNQNRRNVA
jgi:hypothetical protein